MSGFESLTQQPFRAASLAGIFYPNEDVHIRSALQSFGLIQNPKINTRCIFVPHGSWYTMGNALLLAYKSLMETHERPKSDKYTISNVVLLGHCHNSNKAGLFLSESDYFETPIGNLAINKEINKALLSCNTLFELNDIPHLQEDSTETHFPFIKFLFPEAAFVPLLIGGFEPKIMSGLANALHVVFEPIIQKTLFIVSSNSANYADPYLSRMQNEKFIAMVKDKNAADLLDSFHEEKISACGILAMAALLESGLLDESTVTQIPRSDGSLLDVDGRTIHYTALKFS